MITVQAVRESSLKNAEDGALRLLLPRGLAGLLQLLEPRVPEGVVKRDPLLGVDVEEAIDEVLGVVGDGDEGRVGELALDRVFEDLGDAVVIEGQVASEPAWEGKYM